MITFFLLTTFIIVAAIMAVLAFLIGGTTLLVVFGDVIICGLIIYGLIRLVRKPKDGKEI